MSGKSELELKARNAPKLNLDISSLYNNNAQTSVHTLQMPPSPINNEIVEEVTETGFNVADDKNKTPEVYFHKKSMFKISKFESLRCLLYIKNESLLITLFSDVFHVQTRKHRWGTCSPSSLS